MKKKMTPIDDCFMKILFKARSEQKKEIICICKELKEAKHLEIKI